MTCIIAAGGESGLEELIKTKLTDTYRITYIKGSELFVSGRGYELVFFDSEAPRLSGSPEPAVVIAKSGALLPRALPEGSTVILDADDPCQLKAAARLGAYAIDCGHSPSSTVSFTGKSEDTLVVSLNRSITALSGREIQPFELPVPKTADDYTVMSFVALRLLLDDRDSELGRIV